MSSTTETLVSEFETDAVVASVRSVANDVVEVSVRAADGAALPPWTPGAHIDLLLGPDLTRQYSLCGRLAEDGSYTVAVLKEPESRGGSVAVHNLTEGQTLRIRGPRNNFPLAPTGQYIFIAGGIGITPMLPMIEAAIAGGTPWRLHYGGRTRGTMAFLDHLEQYGDRVNIVPQDERGILDLGDILGTIQPNTLVYVCGPEPLLAAVEAACKPWPAGTLHLERFAAKEIEREGDDTAFEVVLQRSGKTISVGADQSVFDAMRAGGVSVLGSCLEGICGTCETGVLEGEIDHRDSILDEDEQEAMDTMMVCVSRCRGARLVLDA